MSQLFAADDLARGWLSVSLAAATDDERPALFRTVYLELYPEGLRLTSTDGYLLLSTFVPNVATGFADETPELDEAPVHAAVAIDDHGRARNLLGHLLGLATAAAKNDQEIPEIRVSLGVVEADRTDRPTFDGFEVPWIVLEHPDHERLKLRTYEGSFPTYRSILTAHTPKRTGAVAFAPEMLTRLGKLGKYHPGDSPVFELCGARKPARITIGGGSSPLVAGAVATVRDQRILDDEDPAEAAA